MREDKVLVFDTDVTVLNDVSLLWRMFEKFSNEQALGLTENQSHWYIKALSYGQRPWPALGRGFNTGVMLMHLQQLRNRKFTSLWETVTKRVLALIPETSLADQDVINAVIKEHPSVVYKIECTWNIQLSDHTISDLCYRDADRISVRKAFITSLVIPFPLFDPRVFHDCPTASFRSCIGILLESRDVYNKHINEFRKLHKVFLEMDGNLLRRRLFGCDKHETVSHVRETCIQV